MSQLDDTSAPGGRAADDIQYLVLFDPADPVLLARVRWPDVFHAISPARPDWQSDPGLFDLPYDTSSTAVSFEEATAIAAGWGATLPGPDAPMSNDPAHQTVIRRMPANWSNLSPAEQRAWSIHLVTSGKPATGRRFGRRRHLVSVATGADATETDETVIDLTDGARPTLTVVEDA
jgi:hypothetical protein